MQEKFVTRAADLGVEQSSCSAPGHTERGTDWGAAAHTYAQVRHGPDGAMFLDPYFLHALVNEIRGQHVIDIGCGAGPWAVLAGQAGAGRVTALDISQNFVDLAQKAVREANLQDQIEVSLGDAATLKFADNTFDKALSINVGCNLPANGFDSHFAEMFRVLKPGGLAIVTAPANLDRVFTDGTSDAARLNQEIESVLGRIGFTTESGRVVPELGTLKQIYRATFVADVSGSVRLLREGEQLAAGEPIWRKLPTQAVPNRYHHEDEYIRSAQVEGFSISAAFRGRFEDETARAVYNQRCPDRPLGPEYLADSPFLVLVLRKPEL